MTRPDVYFTLNTPFAMIIGPCTSVPEGGGVEDDQAGWFVGELKAAPKDRALIVTLLAESLAGAPEEAPTWSSPRTHNYQRFTTADATGGGVTPYFVAGQGGYHNRHKVAKINGQPLITPYVVPGEAGVVTGA